MTQPIPESFFGRDHWSTFAYIATRVVNHDGYPKREHMRTDPKRHPGLAHRGSHFCPGPYPTMLRGGVQLDDHDCADDLEAAGLIVHIGTGIHPRWKLTERGWIVWFEIERQEAAKTLRWSKFQPSQVAT